MNQEVLVSVIMITYQHAEFIRQDIQSVLDQKTDFKFELLLGEDMSTDGTREICMERAEANPDKIRLVLHDRSEMILIKGKPSGRRNFIELFKKAQGKYIALCPGDDMWTDDTKLQQVIDVMEKDPDISVCFHNAKNVYDDGHEVDYVRTWLKQEEIPSIFTLEDIITTNFIPSSGCAFRRSNFEGIPEEFFWVPALDWFLHVEGALRGKIAYIDKLMSIRRIHEQGMISKKPRLTKIDWNLDMLDVVDKQTDGRFQDRINARKIELLHIAMEISLHSEPERAKSMLKRVEASGLLVLSAREKLKARMIIYTPWWSRLLLRFKGGGGA